MTCFVAFPFGGIVTINMDHLSLSDSLTEYSPLKESFSAYITFMNDDGCKVHVPVPATSTKEVLAQPEACFLDELNQKMEIQFKDAVPEYGPLLKPKSEFALKVRIHPRLQTLATLTPIRSSRRLRSSGEANKSDSSPHATASTELDEQSRVYDLRNPHELVQAFVARRTEMRFSQRDVANSLRVLYDIDRSCTLIHRFEAMELSVTNFAKVCPIIRQWLKDTESIEARDSVIRAVLDPDAPGSSTTTVPSVKRLDTSATLPKRRKRTVMSPEMKMKLEQHFVKDPLPSRTTLRELAGEFGVEFDIVRVWFCNRRQKKALRGR